MGNIALSQFLKIGLRHLSLKGHRTCPVITPRLTTVWRFSPKSAAHLRSAHRVKIAGNNQTRPGIQPLQAPVAATLTPLEPATQALE